METGPVDTAVEEAQESGSASRTIVEVFLNHDFFILFFYLFFFWILFPLRTSMYTTSATPCHAKTV